MNITQLGNYFWTYRRPNGPTGNETDLWATKRTFGRRNGLRAPERSYDYPNRVMRTDDWTDTHTHTHVTVKTHTPHTTSTYTQHTHTRNTHTQHTHTHTQHTHTHTQHTRTHTRRNRCGSAENISSPLEFISTAPLGFVSSVLAGTMCKVCRSSS